MISNPLFIIVAESTEIFAPMLQFGWATACSGVTFSIKAESFSRNGPPDAVSKIRSTAARCSLSNV